MDDDNDDIFDHEKSIPMVHSCLYYISGNIIILILLQYLFIGAVIVTLEVGSSSFYFVGSRNDYDLVRTLHIYYCILRSWQISP